MNAEEIHITKVTPDEADLLQSISKQTFVETFAPHNTEQDMQQYLQTNLNTEQLKAELFNPDSEFYFATCNDRVIGYLKINHGSAQTELKNSKTLEIERIYVLAEYHGKRVGQLLYEKAFEIARQMQAEYLWLGVWEKNPRAISFYKKNGFVEFDKHIFKLGSDEQTDIMMRLYLNR